MFSKYTTTLITMHQQQVQIQAPIRAHGMTVVGKRINQVSVIDKRPGRRSKGTAQFRYFATKCNTSTHSLYCINKRKLKK